jgi:hypothetical protein
VARQTSTGTGGGAIKKWHELPNSAVEGVYLKMRQGQQGYTPLVSIKTAAGVIDVPAPTKLRELLEPVTPGVGYVWIKHTGKIPLKGGKTMNTFDVDYDNEYQAGAPALAPAAAVGAAQFDTAAMRAALEARIGADATAAQINGLVQKVGGDPVAIAAGLRELLVLNGVK